MNRLLLDKKTFGKKLKAKHDWTKQFRTKYCDGGINVSYKTDPVSDRIKERDQT
jgi:hypothetical protein